jgi:integrase
MNNSSIGIASQKMSVKKPGLSLVPVAKPKLLDQLREALRSRHYSHRTEQTYCSWVKRFIYFHNVRHPQEMAEPEINAFLTYLAVKEKVAASTQNQALSALLFLYRHVLGREVGDLGEVIRARKPKRLPVVMTREEIKAVLANLYSDKWLMASLMYGAGLRLMECLRLRVQDLDFSRNEILVRDGKGAKDRITMLPESLKTPLQEQLKSVKAIHERDLADGWGRVLLPHALDRKYRNAPMEEPENRRRRAASCGRIIGSEGCAGCCHKGGSDETGHLPYIQAFLRYTFARSRLRHSNGPGALGPQGCQNDNDLYSCLEPGSIRGKKPCGWALK